MGRCLRTPRAVDDLIEIWSFIAQDNPEAADRLLEKIEGVCRKISDHPLIGRERPEVFSGIRSFQAGKYNIYYRQSANGIEIVRVLHAARDIHAQF